MKKVIKYLPGMAIALVLAAAAKGLEAAGRKQQGCISRQRSG